MDVNGTQSNNRHFLWRSAGIRFGVLLFLIYVNDMKGALNCDLLLYADDSVSLIPGTNVSGIENKLSIQLQLVCNWLIDKKLLIHLGKTRSILFGTRKMLRNSTLLKMNCCGTDISSKNSVK